MKSSHSTSGRRGGGGSSDCGNKDRGKRKEMERRSFVQPSITFLGFKFIWLHFSLIYTAEGENSMLREVPGRERMRG